MSSLRVFTVLKTPIQRFVSYKVIFVSGLRLTRLLLKYYMFVLLNAAHSFNPYAVPSTDPEKVHLLGGAEESLEKYR